MPTRRTPTSLRAELCRHALTLPEAWVDHPWGETVVKVRKKIFLFLGVDDGSYPPALGVKLTSSHDQALTVPRSAPMGYGLGKAGWVTLELEADLPPTGCCSTGSRRATVRWLRNVSLRRSTPRGGARRVGKPTRVVGLDRDDRREAV